MSDLPVEDQHPAVQELAPENVIPWAQGLTSDQMDRGFERLYEEIMNMPDKGSRAWLAEIQDLVFDECRDLRDAGQKEYAHDEGNAFANFERLAEDLGLDRKQVLWVYLRKHLDGILAFIRGHRSQREDVRGRINDAIVYLTLLRGMVDAEETTDGNQ